MADDLSEDVLDEETWNDAERYWCGQVADLERSLDQVGEWPSWESRFSGEGLTPLPRESRPIWDGRSERLDRSFQIYQHKVHKQADISAWVKAFEHDELWVEDQSPRLPRAMLVIAMSFSETTADVARSFLRLWMTPPTTVEEMIAFIDTVLDAPRPD